MKKLTVTIAGPVGSGKTTLLRILEKALREAGVDYDVQSLDTPFSAEEALQPYRLKAIARKVERGELEVLLQEVQFRDPPVATCEDCGKSISTSDIREYQKEAGIPGILPSLRRRVGSRGRGRNAPPATYLKK